MGSGLAIIHFRIKGRGHLQSCSVADKADNARQDFTPATFSIFEPFILIPVIQETLTPYPRKDRIHPAPQHRPLRTQTCQESHVVKTLLSPLVIGQFLCNNMCRKEGQTMATNLAIDDNLLRLALKVGGLKTKRETVNEALSEYIERRKQKDVLRLFGKIEIESSYDYKKVRATQ
jgi:Arc/MetJ family transcription regulator